MADYQVSVIYNSNKIIPAPYISLRKNIERYGDGSSRIKSWSISVIGKISAIEGSPDYNGVFWTNTGYPPSPDPAQTVPSLRIRNLRNKLAAMQELFNIDGKWFEIQPADGSPSIKFQPRITDFNFNEGPWFNYIDYSIQMEADVVYFGNNASENIENAEAEESWSLEPIDDFRPNYRITHTLSYQAKNRFLSDGSGIDKYGWEIAKEIVEAAQGYDSSILNDGSYSNYNKNVSKQINKAGGIYSLTESWILSKTNYIEDVTIEHSYNNNDGLDIVRISGTITGLQSTEDVSERYTNALARASEILTDSELKTKCEQESGITLNPIILNKTVSKNKLTGVISYNAGFDNRPVLPNGYLSYNVDINFDNLTTTIAQIPIPFRTFGPILQNTNAGTQAVCTISAVIAYRVVYGDNAVKPTYNPLPDFLIALGFTPPSYYLISDKENWNPRTGRYTRTSSFIYQLV